MKPPPPPFGVRWQPRKLSGDTAFQSAVAAPACARLRRGRSLCRRTPYSSFSEPMEFLERLLGNLETIPIGSAHLDNVPFGAGSSLAQLEHLLVERTVERLVLVFLYVDRPGAAGEFLEHGDRVAAAGQAIAHVHLHVHLGSSALE